jgi:hypothetical protein
MQAGTKKSISLVNGQSLCSLMIKHGIGVKQNKDDNMLVVDEDLFTQLASQSQKRLAPITGRTDVWADFDPAIFQRVWGSSETFDQQLE